MYHDDEIHEDEFDDFLNTANESFRKGVIDHIARNKDKSVKSVGDKVLVWDTSRLTEIETGEVNTDTLDHEILNKFPSIVIEENLRINKDIVLGEDRVYPCNLDLMIWNKTLGKKFYTKSEFVKITSNKV